MSTKSEILFNRAQLSIPGGVNSPVRAFKSVGGNPIFIAKAKGAYMYDADGNAYIDYINSWGPLIMGHAYAPVVKAIQEKVMDSTSFGAPTELEIEMAELIKSMVPNIDLVRMVNSGTEACMSAIRLARGYTGCNKIIKFEGCYHGHADAFLVKAGSGVATLNIQNVPGVPESVSGDTLTAAYNDLEAVQKLVAAHEGQIAAIIIEPVAGNMGCVVPAEGFLEGLRKLCNEHKIVLIFDEVMTGFRLAAGGAQQRLKVDADLVTYGKVIGAGMPVGAFGGKREIMEHIAPLGSVYQAGTLSGNPLAMIAGYTLLKELQGNPSVYDTIDTTAATLHTELEAAFIAGGIPVSFNRLGSMFSLFFSKSGIKNFEEAAKSDIALFKQYFHFMLRQGIYLAPSAFETWFVSYAIGETEVAKTVDATRAFIKQLKP